MAYKDREVQREYQKAHYSANKAIYLSRAKSSKRRSTDRLNTIVVAHLVAHPCVICGETDPDVLDFDHIDPRFKCFDISKRGNRKPETLLKEMAKCQILCANCHRRKHALLRRLSKKTP